MQHGRKELLMENEPKGIEEADRIHFRVKPVIGHSWDYIRAKALLPDGSPWEGQTDFTSGSERSLNRAKKKLRKHHRIACIGTRTELV